MSKSLRLNIHPRTLEAAKKLYKGHREFNELPLDQRMMLYDCDFDLDGLVTTEELLEFRIELAKEGKLPFSERVKAHAKLVANNGKQKLGIQQG